MMDVLEPQKSSPFNFVPIVKTPWGGRQISKLKRRYFPEQEANIPERIGESLEIHVQSLLVKWIEAAEPLSIQVHPNHTHPLLGKAECGKYEAWFVYQLHNPSPIYLGFKEGLSKEKIQNCLQSSNPLDCLHSFVPKKNSYISIPAGCVHALGSGIFIAEPQHVIPEQDGITWRIFDWNRLYNTEGQRDDRGKPRALHLNQALSAIDWNLPCGKELEKKFVQVFEHGEYFSGNEYNPFALQVFTKPEEFSLNKFAENHFSLLTVFSGRVTIFKEDKKILELQGGESACLPKSLKMYQIKIESMFEEDPCALVFALNKEYLSGVE